MRIGVNALYLLPGGVGGTEIYLRSLLAGLSRINSGHEWFVFANRETSGLAPASFTEVATGINATFRPGRLFWEQTKLAALCRRLKIDVLLNPGFTAPLFAPCPQVTVFHDLQHLRHPEFFRPWELPFWRFFLWGAVHRSRRLIAVSEATRADLLLYYRIPPEKVTVVPHGVDDRFFPLAASWSPQPYLLCASTLHPHKNHVRLLHAFARFRAEQPTYKLVLTGVMGFVSQPVVRLIAELGLEKAVDVKGWIPREELYPLFEHAAAFIYPSLFEGFGLPVLEALAAGLPTACSDIEPLRSISADAALRFNPASDDDLLKALRRITSDDLLRARLHAAGPLQARGFSWDAAARETLAVLEAQRK